MGIYLTGLFFVLGAAFLAALFAWLVRRWGADEGRVDNNEATGQIFTIVGGLNVVLLAFVLISLFDAASAARDGSYTESNSLVAAYWASHSLPEADRRQIHDECVAYAKTVLRQEWPEMQRSVPVAGPGWSQLDDLRRTVADTRIDSADNWLTDRKLEAANQLWQVYQARQARLTAASSHGVSTVVWFALIIGTIITVMLAYFFGGTKPITHMIIVATVAATITLMLFAIYQLQNPFSGGVKVEPTAFDLALDRLG